VDHLGLQRSGYHAMTVGEAILASKPQVPGQGMRPVGLDEPPDVALVVIGCNLSRLPAIDPAGGGDLPRHDAVAEVGRKDADAVDFLGIALSVREGDKTTQRDATQPDRAAAHGASGKDELVTQSPEQGPIGQVSEIEID